MNTFTVYVPDVHADNITNLSMFSTKIIPLRMFSKDVQDSTRWKQHLGSQIIPLLNRLVEGIGLINIVYPCNCFGRVEIAKEGQ